MTAKFQSLKRFLIEDTKGFMSPETSRDVSILLNRCLALTVLRAIEDVRCYLNSNLSSLESVLLFQGFIPFDGLSCNLFTCRLDNGV